MNSRKNIRVGFAYGVLLLIILSITPKVYLHDLFADHKDVSSCNDSPAKGPCIHQQGFNCDLNELIVPHEYLLAGQLSADLEIIYNCASVSPFSVILIKNDISGTAGRSPPGHV